VLSFVSVELSVVVSPLLTVVLVNPALLAPIAMENTSMAAVALSPIRRVRPGIRRTLGERATAANSS
jgi:hypothetical protein